MIVFSSINSELTTALARPYFHTDLKDLKFV